MHISAFNNQDIYDYQLIKYYLEIGGNPDTTDKKGHQVLAYAKKHVVGKTLIDFDLLAASKDGDCDKF